MWYKNKALWAAVAAIVFSVVGALTGNDIKAVVCGPSQDVPVAPGVVVSE